jgi:hypothetical protein
MTGLGNPGNPLIPKIPVQTISFEILDSPAKRGGITANRFALTLIPYSPFFQKHLQGETCRLKAETEKL